MTKSTNKLFFLFVSAHLLIWTLVPSLSNKNLPLDTIEHLAWASNLDWGFNKHPPMVAFVLNVFYQIFGNQDWAYYFLSQIFVCFAFFIVWKLSEDFFKNTTHRLISILLLSGISFYNYTTPEFNVYICELPFWALTVYFSWKASKNNKTQDWLLLGFFAGLGVLSHYLFIYLLIALEFYFLYMIINKKINFKCFISLVPFFLILLPHLNWLIENNYTTLTYGMHRTGLSEFSIINHITLPFIFLGKQIGLLIPFFIMFLFFIYKIKTKFNLKDNKVIFLLIINVVPIILIFLTSLFLGIKIRTMWMTPFYLFLGMILVYFFQKQIILKRIKRFVFVFLFLFILSPSAYLYVSLSQDNKRTDYPGKEIADLVQRKWDRNYKNEIGFVVGDEWFGGNLSYHLKSRPIWFNELDPNLINSDKGVIYTGNSNVLKKICPGLFGSILKQGICMIGNK
tara:strand:+ start:2497 stop:3855 length:1359 start_codon:yes stop_codon:yes gene_type:complete